MTGGVSSPNDALVRLLRALPPVAVQNRLMRVSDREIALSMMYMQDADRSLVFSRLAARKVARLREELTLHARLRITYEQYRRAVESVVEALQGEKRGEGLRSYIRPTR